MEKRQDRGKHIAEVEMRMFIGYTGSTADPLVAVDLFLWWICAPASALRVCNLVLPGVSVTRVQERGCRDVRMLMICYAQNILTSFDGWQQTIEQLAAQCQSLPPLKIDTTKVDETIVTQAKCWLQSKSVSHISAQYSSVML